MKKRIIFMGTPEFAVPSLLALKKDGHDLLAVVTQPDRPKGRGNKLQASPVKETAVGLGLDVIQPYKVKDEKIVEMLREMKPDVIAVAAFGQILPESILAVPLLGCINVHASLLPQYRGAAPLHWAILNGEKRTGVTTMLMDSGLDTGDILLKKEIAITPEMTYGRLHDIISVIGADLLIETIKLYGEGKIVPEKQKEGDASYAPRLLREHERIVWDKTAEGIHNQVRGLDPWPGAYTVYLDKPLKIRGSRVYQEKGSAEKPGTVLGIIKGKGFIVQTGMGSILITDVQPFGKKIMPATSFVNGYQLEKGYVFDG